MTDIDKHPIDQVSLADPKDEVQENRLAPAQALSEEEFLEAEKSLKRKLDMRLLAAVWLIFVMNYLDRVRTHLFSVIQQLSRTILTITRRTTSPQQK